MKHPFQIVLSNKSGNLLFTTAQNQIQVFDTRSGERIGYFIDNFDPNELIKEKIQKEQERQLSAKEPDAKKHKTNNSEAKVPTPGEGAPKIFNYIRALHLTNNEKYLVAATDSDKAAVIFEINELNKENILTLMKRQRFPKRPSAISTSVDNKDVLLGDKFGDVYSIPIDSEETQEKNPETDPLLGHVSMLTDVTVGEHNDKQYILSTDRDEHIRVSNYPNGYIIENFLFGHSEFISNIVIPSFAPDNLISGGGDDSIFLWNWVEGKLIEKFPLKDLISKYLTDEHLAPSKFQNEENNLKEFSVAQIVPVESTSSVAILIEKTDIIIILKLVDSKLSLDKIIEFKDKIVSITASATKIIASVENDNDQLLQEIDVNSKEFLNLESFNKISENSKVEISSKAELFPLYTVSQLRKRSEY